MKGRKRFNINTGIRRSNYRTLSDQYNIYMHGSNIPDSVQQHQEQLTTAI